MRDYASAYSRILTSKKLPHIYIDAFAGAGPHISRQTGDLIPGSPLNALNVRPPFRESHFIDLDAEKVGYLQSLAGSRDDVRMYEGDCNDVLIEQIFSTLQYKSCRRALCLLDPYGLDLRWEVIFQAGQLGTIDMFLNFPVMHLQQAPARVRFLSIEPLLEDIGAIDLTGISWVIVGGESGPGARPMKKEWVISIRRQCEAYGVPFFFKQWGGVRKTKKRPRVRWPHLR